MKKRKSEKLHKVALGNEIIDVSPGAFMTFEPVDESEYSWPSALSFYEAGFHPCPPKGGCFVCGCPPEAMPMVNRGTGWCSENHRKELERYDQEKA